MENTLVTQLKYKEEDNGDIRIVVLGRSDAVVGDQVNVRAINLDLGDFYVKNLKVVSLSDVDQEDLDSLHRVYKRKRVLWSQLEQAYKSGLPGEFEISIITLSEEKPKTKENRTSVKASFTATTPKFDDTLGAVEADEEVVDIEELAPDEE